jgi:hypothetical protein
LFLKTENSRRVAESRPVCVASVGLKGADVNESKFVLNIDALFAFNIL